MIRRTRIGRVDTDVHRIGSFADVIIRLIDANGKASGNGSQEVAARARQKRLGNFRIADPADKRSATCTVEGQNAQQILETARNAVGSVVFLGVGIAKLASRGDNDVLARLDVNSSIRPRLLAGDLHFIVDAPLAGRSGSSF